MRQSNRELNGRRSHQRKVRLPSIYSFPKGMFETSSEWGTLIAKSMSGPSSKANKCGRRVGIKLMRQRAVSSNSPGERFVLFPGVCYCQEQDAADDKKPMAGSQRVPWGPGKCLGDFSSPHQLAYTCQKKIPSIFSWLMWKIKTDHPYLTGDWQSSWERVQDKAEQDLQFTVWHQK